MKKTLKCIFITVFALLSLTIVSACSSSKLTVTFDACGGSEIQSIQVVSGQKIDKPTDPAREGYVFDGWYVSNTDFSDDNKWSFIGFPVTNNLTLYAKWNAVSGIVVNFEKNGGIGTANNIVVTYDANYGELPNNLLKETYKFDGWWSGDNGIGSRIDSNTLVKNSVNHTLYAKWNKLYNGAGTQFDPYQIETSEQMFDLAREINSGVNYSNTYFVLNNDIDLANAEWVPAGQWFSSNTFRGFFDGKGYKVHNFRIVNFHSENVGLFALNNGVIKNLGVENFTIDVEIYGMNINVGGLVGRNNGIIENCYAVGAINAKSTYQTGKLNTGGLVGYSEYSVVHENFDIVDCFANVNISIIGTATATVGGLIGNNDSAVSNSYALGSMTAKATSVFAGGLIGNNASPSFDSIYKCYATGNVSATDSPTVSVGGLIGSITSGGISSCYAAGNVDSLSTTSTNRTGGLIGSYSSLLGVYNCFSTGNINATSQSSYTTHAGGLIGYFNTYSGVVENCYATGNVSTSKNRSSESDMVGALIGSRAGGTIENCFATGNVFVISLSANLGGLIGFNWGDTDIVNSYRYQGQHFSWINGIEEHLTPTNEIGLVCSLDNLSDPSFFIDIMNWSEQIWDLNGLNFTLNRTPKLQ